MAKVKPVNLAEIPFHSNELSQFWRQYFSHLSLSFSSLLSQTCGQNITVRYLHRDIMPLEDYLKTAGKSSLIKCFRTNPGNEIGFLYLTGELCNSLIHFTLGGRISNDLDNVHFLTQFDEKLLTHIVSDMMKLIEKHLSTSDMDLPIELNAIDPVKLSLMEAGLEGKKIISIQQFLIATGQNTHVIDLAFSHRFLEGRVLI